VAGELAAVLMNRFHQEQMSAVIRDELVVFSKGNHLTLRFHLRKIL